MYESLCAYVHVETLFEPRCEKTGLQGFRPGLTQTGLCSHRRWLEAWNYGFRKKRDCTIHVAKTKALISCAVTAQLICAFVFAYAKNRFSHYKAHMLNFTEIYIAYSENKGADQLHGYREADLHLSFRICKNPIFS